MSWNRVILIGLAVGTTLALGAYAFLTIMGNQLQREYERQNTEVKQTSALTLSTLVDFEKALATGGLVRGSVDAEIVLATKQPADYQLQPAATVRHYQPTERAVDTVNPLNVRGE